MEDMKLEVIGREVIKPTSPAPQDHLQLSFLDFSAPAIYVPTIFFYKGLAGESSEIISGRLKSSLSKTLSSFYPLAGQIEGVSINCNDEGAVFTEARTDLLLSDLLKNNLDDSLGELSPVMAPEESAETWPLLSVKVTFFGSGSGFAIAMAISHRICDVASVLTFAQGWAATTAEDESNDVAATPQFAGTTIYPPPNSFSMQPPPIDSLFDPGCKRVTSRFIFKSSKISELKRKAASQSVPVPSRVEAITSLIWRCARNASRSNSAAPKPTLMFQAMDLRLRIPSDVLSPLAIGNLLSTFYLKKDAESEMESGEIVSEFRKAKEEINEIIKESLQGDDTTTIGLNLLSVLAPLFAELKPDVDIYSITSWCKKPFYEVDFGWGTPVWLGTTSYTIIPSVMLVDSKDGEDIEAWVVLPKQDMDVLIRDQDLLTYALLNPPVFI